jgi:hypothetical protein
MKFLVLCEEMEGSVPITFKLRNTFGFLRGDVNHKCHHFRKHMQGTNKPSSDSKIAKKTPKKKISPIKTANGESSKEKEVAEPLVSVKKQAINLKRISMTWIKNKTPYILWNLKSKLFWIDCKTL